MDDEAAVGGELGGAVVGDFEDDVGHAVSLAGENAGDPWLSAGGVYGELGLGCVGGSEGDVCTVGTGEAGFLVDPPLVVEVLSVRVGGAGGVECDGLLDWNG